MRLRPIWTPLSDPVSKHTNQSINKTGPRSTRKSGSTKRCRGPRMWAGRHGARQTLITIDLAPDGEGTLPSALCPGSGLWGKARMARDQETLGEGTHTPQHSRGLTHRCGTQRDEGGINVQSSRSISRAQGEEEVQGRVTGRFHV